MLDLPWLLGLCIPLRVEDDRRDSPGTHIFSDVLLYTIGLQPSQRAAGTTGKHRRQAESTCVIIFACIPIYHSLELVIHQVMKISRLPAPPTRN